MKSLKILIAITAISMVGLQQARSQEDEKLPSAESILKRYVEVTGGLEKHKSVKSMVATGTFSLPAAGMNATMKMTTKMPDKVVAEIEIAGAGTVNRGSNGKYCWEDSVMQGPRLITGEEATAMMEEANLARIYDPGSFYKSMKTEGIEEVDGEKCYKVILTKKDDNEIESYYSIETGLEVKSVQEQVSQMGPMKIEAYPSDYREVDGLKTPFKIQQKIAAAGMNPVISFDKIEINVDIDDSEFDVPESIQKLIDKEAAKKEKAGAGSDK